MAGLQKSSSPKPELLHSTTDRWPAGSHQHWHTGSSLFLPQRISGSILAIHLIRNFISFSHFLKFMVFTSVFVVMLLFHLLDLIVFKEPLSLYNNRVHNFTAQCGAKPQTFAIHQTNKLSSHSFLSTFL